MFNPVDNNTSTVLHLGKLDDYAEAELPEISKKLYALM
jgi:hypothetical protein